MPQNEFAKHVVGQIAAMDSLQIGVDVVGVHVKCNKQADRAIFTVKGSSKGTYLSVYFIEKKIVGMSILGSDDEIDRVLVSSFHYEPVDEFVNDECCNCFHPVELVRETHPKMVFGLLSNMI